ncbi:MAG: SIR2 family protein [Candidatus Odinarchaeota archaeon]
MLARLPFRVIITTCFDNRLERALKEAERPFVKIIGNADVADEDVDKLLLVKMYGDLDQPDSLVLTETDYRRFLNELPTISDVLKGLISSCTLLLLVHDLDDTNVKDLYDRATRRFDLHAQRSYAFYQHASAYAINFWEKHNNVSVTQAEPISLLRNLEHLLQEQQADSLKTASSISVPDKEAIESILKHPYKFLNAYTEEDSAIFFGRNQEKRKLLSKVASYRLVLLYGESGVGKTSLIRAGVLPALAARGYRPVYSRVLDDPKTAIIHTIKSTLKPQHRERTLEPNHDEVKRRGSEQRLRQQLSELQNQWDLLSQKISTLEHEQIVETRTDEKFRLEHQLTKLKAERQQFEEQLTNLEAQLSPNNLTDRPQEKPQTLYDYLHHVTKTTENLLILFIDQFEELFTQVDSETRNAFIKDIGTIYKDNALKLKIVLSFRENDLAKLNVFAKDIPEIFNNYYRLERLTPEQAKKAIIGPAEICGFSYEAGLIDQLLTDLGVRDNEIDPPQLQIVCDRLYEALGANEKLITRRHYEQLGGASVILTSYLDQVLKRYSSEQRTIIREILKAFITSSDTKAVLTINNLAHRARLPVGQAKEMIDELLRSRLIRRAESEIQYELSHEYLVTRIASWMSDQERADQRAREVLEQGLAKWTRFSLLLSQDELTLINNQRQALGIGKDELELLVRSAIRTGIDTEHWLERATEQLKITVLREAANSKEVVHRQRTAKLIGRFAISELQDVLEDLIMNDLEPAIRHEAALNLGCMDQEAFIHCIEVGLSGSPEHRQRVIEAVANVQDAEVEGIDFDHLLDRFKLKWPLRRFRLKCNRTHRNKFTFYAALAGMFGAALGALIGFILSQIPSSLLVVSILLPTSYGLLVGFGTGFGIGTVEAMGERRFSAFYLAGGALGAGIPSMAYLGIDLNPLWALLGAFVGLGLGSVIGSFPAIIVGLTKKISSPTRRIVIRAILGIFSGIIIGSLVAMATHFGLVYYKDAQGSVIPYGASFGFCTGFLNPGSIIMGVEFAERKLQHREQVGHESIKN